MERFLSGSYSGLATASVIMGRRYNYEHLGLLGLICKDLSGRGRKLIFQGGMLSDCIFHSMVCALSLHGMCSMSVNTHANTISERWMRNIDTYMKEYIISMKYEGSKEQG